MDLVEIDGTHFSKPRMLPTKIDALDKQSDGVMRTLTKSRAADDWSGAMCKTKHLSLAAGLGGVVEPANLRRQFGRNDQNGARCPVRQFIRMRSSPQTSRKD